MYKFNWFMLQNHHIVTEYVVAWETNANEGRITVDLSSGQKISVYYTFEQNGAFQSDERRLIQIFDERLGVD